MTRGSSRVAAAFAFALAALALSSLACRRPAGPSGDHDDAGVPAAAVAHGARRVRVSPALLDTGRIQTARASRRAVVGVVQLPADVVATPEGAAEAGTLLAGRVARFQAREGDRVARGQVLAWIDAPEAARAVADVIRGRARVETQSRKVARLEGLVAVEAAAAVALEEARLELALARADLAAARTVVASLGLGEPSAQAARGGTVAAQLPVRSPADGVVVERSAPIGAHVTPETPLFRILGEGRVLVEARVADGASLAFAPSDRARVRRRGHPACEARVIGVLPHVDPATRSRKLRLALDGPCAGLVPGSQVEVEVEIPGRSDGGAGDLGDAVVVPARAALEARGATVVFVRTSEPGGFEVRAVEPGLRMGEDLVVRAGVDEGEDVVVDGAILLKGELMKAELGGGE